MDDKLTEKKKCLYCYEKCSAWYCIKMIKMEVFSNFLLPEKYITKRKQNACQLQNMQK